mmetsp:Transcript_76791/g.217292  ORF Transcript_76791/g.217292 Transcript_76791/m.217292 type:complete len:107 (+) Transcript_76791:330-650(+)
MVHLLAMSIHEGPAGGEIMRCRAEVDLEPAALPPALRSPGPHCVIHLGSCALHAKDDTPVPLEDEAAGGGGEQSGRADVCTTAGPRLAWRPLCTPTAETTSLDPES